MSVTLCSRAERIERESWSRANQFANRHITLTHRVVSTRSNLKGAVLREITATLGLDYAPFELKETPIINRLVKFRNTIAHGGGIPIQPADYNALHTETIALMDSYKDMIQDAADNDGHLR